MTGRYRIGMCLAAGIALAAPAAAKAPSGLKALLGQASDSALGKLEQPGAFYADKAIRIALPGPAKKLSGLMKLADKTGLTGDLSKTMNDAAGLAAGAAKPVFRNAIQKMTLTDGIGIATGGGTAGTDYLQTSSGMLLQGQLRPLVESALRKTGALTQFEARQDPRLRSRGHQPRALHRFGDRADRGRHLSLYGRRRGEIAQESAEGVRILGAKHGRSRAETIHFIAVFRHSSHMLSIRWNRFRLREIVPTCHYLDHRKQRRNARKSSGARR